MKTEASITCHRPTKKRSIQTNPTWLVCSASDKAYPAHTGRRKRHKKENPNTLSTDYQTLNDKNFQQIHKVAPLDAADRHTHRY